jgi:ribonuclease R
MQNKYKSSDIEKFEYPVPDRNYILSVIEDKPYNFSQLQEILKLNNESQITGLKRRLKAMVRDGQLIFSKNLYKEVPKSEIVTGPIQAHSLGFGFLLGKKRDEDCYVGYQQMKKLLHLDVVEARVVSSERRKREAKIRKVISFSKIILIQVIQKDNKFIFLQSNGVPIENLEIDNPPKNFKDDTYLKAEIIKHPFEHKITQVKVIEVLTNKYQILLTNILLKQNINTEWPKDVIKQANEIEDKNDNFIDLTNLPFVTIDGSTAKDLDDAVYCKKQEHGFKLYVAIAHVSHYIKKDTPIDKEAFDRGTSVYFPATVIPMLPERLSNDLCSLNPKVPKKTLVCIMDLDHNGNYLKIDFVEANIVSKEKLTYSKVNKYFDNIINIKNEDVKQNLNDLLLLYNVLTINKEKRNALDINSKENFLKLDHNQNIESIDVYERGVSNKIIEECMIKANVAAATWLINKESKCIFRNHPKPSSTKTERLINQLNALNINILDGNLSDILKRLNELSSLNVYQLLVLQSIEIAKYSDSNEGHFGLGLTRYSHFTSPIRRYPDLMLHRIICHVLNNSKLDIDLEDIAQSCSEKERNAESAERDFTSLLKCEYAKKFIGQKVSSFITGIHDSGIYVYLNELLLDAFIPIGELPGHGYTLDEHKVNVTDGTSTFSFGQSLKVEILKIQNNKIVVKPI